MVVFVVTDWGITARVELLYLMGVGNQVGLLPVLMCHGIEMIVAFGVSPDHRLASVQDVSQDVLVLVDMPELTLVYVVHSASLS